MALTQIQTKPCVKCGCVDRNKSQQCKACNKKRAAAWYVANSEKVKASAAAWAAANPEKVKVIKKSWGAQNLFKSKAKSTAWRKANPEKNRVFVAAWRAVNPFKAKALIAAWQAANPEAGRIIVQNRRVRKLANGGVLSRNLSNKLFALQKGKCACCKQPLGNKFHLDHIMPLFLGGSNTDDNIQLLRAVCNNQKSFKHPIDFMQQRGYLI